MAFASFNGQVAKSTDTGVPVVQTITAATHGLTDITAVMFTISDVTTSLGDDTRVIMESMSFGFTDGTNQYAIAGGIENGQADMDTGRMQSSTYCLLVINENGTILCKGSVAFDGDDIDITWVTNNASAYRINYTVIAGVNANVGTMTVTTGTSVTVSGKSFRPSALLMAGNLQNVSDSFATHAMWNLGFVADADNHGFISHMNRDATATVEQFSRLAETGIFNELTTTGTEDKILDFSSWNSDGFTLSKASGGTETKVGYLMLDGVRGGVTNFTSPASTGNQDITTDFDPEHVMLFSNYLAAATTITATDASMMVGQAKTGNGQSIYIADNDANTTSVSRGAISGTKIITNGTLTSLTHQATLSSVGTNKFTLNWTAAASGFDYLVFYLAEAIALTAQDISHSLTIDNVTINQNHVLTAQDISHSLTIDNNTLSVIHNLTVQNIEHSLTVDATTITQNHVVSVDDIVFSTQADDTTIAQNHVVAVQDIEHTLNEDNATVSVVYTLTVQDIEHSLSSDNTTINQNHVVVGADVSHGLTTNVATINQNHIVVTQDIEHSLTTDSTAITQNHIIVVQDIEHSLTTDNTTVVEGSLTLLTDDIAHSLTTDEATINQNHITVTQDVSIASSIDSVTITQNHILVTQEITHGLTTDSTTILQNHIVAVDDIAFSTEADEDSISQNHILATQDIENNLTVDVTNVILNFSLLLQDISLSTSLDTTVVSQDHNLIVNDTAVNTQIDAITITQNHIINTDNISIEQLIDMAISRRTSLTTLTGIKNRNRDVISAISVSSILGTKKVFALTGQRVDTLLSGERDSEINV